MTDTLPTWKNTLNSQLRSTLWALDGIAAAAVEAGYPFYEWNGVVYRTADRTPVCDAGLLDIEPPVEP